MSISFTILGIVVVLILYAIILYNGFVKLRVRVNGDKSIAGKGVDGQDGIVVAFVTPAKQSVRAVRKTGWGHINAGCNSQAGAAA
jgi:hypothetical protein